MTTRHSKNITVLKALEKISGKKLTLGNLLLAIRQAEELSQAEFALKLGVSKQYLCDLERGRRFAGLKASVEYANRLKYSPHQFLRLALQDRVNREGINFLVDVKAA